MGYTPHGVISVDALSSASITAMNDPADHKGMDLARTTKRITLETDLAVWADQQSALLGITTSAFVSTLLEWARDEDIANDEMLFHQKPGPPPPSATQWMPPPSVLVSSLAA